jgi:hypothetical protein
MRHAVAVEPLTHSDRIELPERMWETHSEVVAADPGREFAFAVLYEG